MNIRFIHDLEKKIFVNDAGTSLKTIPEIAYGMKPVWEWEFINSAGEAWDFSQVVSWKAVVDTDYLHTTEPMCRTLSGIYVDNGIVYCPLDALTTTYRDKVNGKELTKGFYDLTGYDASGVKIFYFHCSVNCLYVLDPEEGVDPLDPPENYISPSQVTAIAQGVVDAALNAYTPPAGGEGPTGPAPQFEFSATGITGTWHATWVPGDLYLRVSTDEGETWQGPIPLGTAQATFPLVAEYSDEITYATGALVAYGTPSGLYQAKEPVGYDQSPATHPAKWQQIAGPGTAGTSSTWLLGSGAPADELGNDNDQYLDELYNHYKKTDGVWSQVGNIKGANGAGINNRGAWVTDAAYSVGDGVTSNGSVWCCKVPHTGQEPPATSDGVSLYWDLFLARGTTGVPGAAGTVQIVAVNLLAPTANPYASEGSGSTAARRLYTLNIPRGSTGPAGSLRIELGPALEPDEDPILTELAGSTPYNRAYQLQVSQGPRGEQGNGLYFNAVGTLAQRAQYDSAVAGYCYSATDIMTDDQDQHYQAMYFKQSASIGDWSDAIRLYMGAAGEPGDPGEQGLQGLPGENAAVKPDQEFVADDLFEGTLIVEGTDPIAQVEVNDVSGHGHALPIGSGDGDVAITTRRDTGQTLLGFGPSVDLTYGGRVRFAQGLSGESLYQMWLGAGHTGSQTDYINWLKETATRIAITAADLIDIGDGDLGVSVETDGVVIAAIDEAGVQYLLADTEVSYAGGVCTVNLQRLLTLKSIETIPDTWQLILAGGKGEKGEPGDQPELSSSAAVALAATAAAGVSTVAARADHVHPTTGLVTPSQLANFLSVTLRGVANGVASLGVDGKVPATQLPEMSGSGGLQITRLRLARPYFDDVTHLVVESATWGDFSDVTLRIDTANVSADRAKVLGFTGAVFVTCPAEGLGGVFDGQTVLVDLSAVTSPSFVRYKWVSSGGSSSDWYATYFPSTGEAYVAAPASSGGTVEPPVEPTETQGTLMVTITGSTSGQWSVDGGTTWHASGASALLDPGVYAITYKDVAGYITPANGSATVVASESTTASGTYVAQPDSSDPTDYDMVWNNGTEPTLGEGKKIIYVSPAGAGNFSGDSWANAKAGLYTAGLAASDGDLLYVQEGAYTSHLAPVAGTKSIGIYGGFTIAGGTWATRDGFASPTIIDASSNPSVPFIRPESGVTQTVDGLACTGFTGGVMLKNNGSATVKNCAIYDCDGVTSSHAVDNCLILNCTGGVGAATDCVFVGVDITSDTSGTVVIGTATDCTFTNCSGYSIVHSDASNCTLENCSVNGNSGCVRGAAEGCTFLNCSSSNSSSTLVYESATNCTFTNCTSICNSNIEYSNIVYGPATNCTFTNCSSSSSISNTSKNSICRSATNCTFTNCSSAGGNNASLVSSLIIINCTFARCVALNLLSGGAGTNCVVWNNTITIVSFGTGTNNAAPAYIDANTLVLGTDNTLAKFTSIGTITTIGYSTDLNSKSAADFGNFRPIAGSVLIGAGVAVSGITEDIEGNLRPDPPTIGAYEYVEEV
ncbi:MAG: right-handed parallel beta-helix repeat-containing protein [Lentisphaeria bacterium]